MSHPPANNFRTRTIAERIAQAVPSGGAFTRVRRLLKPVFERVLASTDGGLRSVLPGGEVVLVAPAFRHITWNEEEYAAFRAAVRAGDVVLEAGANVGAYTTLFAQWAGPAGRVVAFEPDPIAYAGLKAHLVLNGVHDRVAAVPAAIAADGDGRLRFALFESSGISRLATGSEQPGTTIREVQSTSIDRYCAEHHVLPDVIKIDVEGAELAALQGARRAIAHADPRLQLFVEMHPHLWPAFGISAADLQREIELQGLIPEQLDGGRDDLWTTEGVCLRLRRPRLASP
jgi:FkbM family methyltransferase